MLAKCKNCNRLVVYAESVKNRHFSFLTLFKQVRDNSE